MRYLTPPQVARLFGVAPEKIVAFIRDGELQAIDMARRGSRRPRYRIAPHALQDFERQRMPHPPAPKPAPRRSQRKPVKQYV
jgi:Helix-turn-helix domain